MAGGADNWLSQALLNMGIQSGQNPWAGVQGRVDQQQLLAALANFLGNIGGRGSSRPAGASAGNTVTIPAFSGVGSVPQAEVISIPPVDEGHIQRFKVTFGVLDLAGALPAFPYGAGLEIRSKARVENEEYAIVMRVGVGNLQTFYTLGRSLAVFAINPFNVPLTAVYALDNEAIGTAIWQYHNLFTLPAGVPTAITPPPFSKTMILMQSNAAAPTNILVEQFLGGAVVAGENVATARSTEIPLLQGSAVRLTATGAMTGVVLFYCAG